MKTLLVALLLVAAPQDDKMITLQHIEDAFWACDYIGTVHGLEKAPMEICGMVTQEIIQRKFKGNSEEQLKWWRENKPAQHERMKKHEEAKKK